MSSSKANKAAIFGPQEFELLSIPLRNLQLPCAGDMHVWFLDLEQLSHPLQGALGGQKNSANDTRLTAGQLLFSRRFYLRLLIGAYLGVPGKAVKINRSERGKPVLDSDSHKEELHFSMAKSEERLLIGFSSSHHVGVDLEPAERRSHNARGVASRYFSSGEAASLAAMDDEILDEAFLRTWACKEAVVKASGQGIANQLCRFTVETDPGRPVSMLEFENEDAANWSLALLRPEKGFLGAVAVPAKSVGIRAFRLLPAS